MKGWVKRELEIVASCQASIRSSPCFCRTSRRPVERTASLYERLSVLNCCTVLYSFSVTQHRQPHQALSTGMRVAHKSRVPRPSSFPHGYHPVLHPSSTHVPPASEHDYCLSTHAVNGFDSGLKPPSHGSHWIQDPEQNFSMKSSPRISLT